MARKTNKQRIKGRLDEAITVGQLIELLKDMPTDTYVGRVGHFGEANLMDKYDFSHIREAYITPSGSWRGDKECHINILDLCVPDIGPDPD